MDSVNKQPGAQLEKVEESDKDQLAVLDSADEQPKAQRHRLEKVVGEERLIVLCDGVFAIAITLLVINIKIPAGLPDEGAFNSALYVMFSTQVISYLITFIVVASYWAQHRRLMKFVKLLDDRFIAFTFLFLAFIAFFPVTSSITGEGYGYAGAIILYTLTFAGCGFSSLILWLYASWHHRLIDQQLTRDEIISRMASIALAPVYFSLSLLLLLIPSFKPDNIFWTWLLLPFLSIIIWRVRSSKLVQRLRAKSETTQVT